MSELPAPLLPRPIPFNGRTFKSHQSQLVTDLVAQRRNTYKALATHKDKRAIIEQILSEMAQWAH